MEVIITKWIFPLLCFSKSDRELWEEDQVEYVHKKIDAPIDDFRDPITAAEELLVGFVSVKNSQTFVPIMQMINQILQELQTNPNPELKFGALSMMCLLADVVMTEESPVREHMEGFMAAHVFPELNSHESFLRAKVNFINKACDVITAYSKLNYQDEKNLEFVFHGVLTKLSDKELPVRVSSSLALGQFLKYPQACEAMKPHVCSVMQTLMTTTNEIDLDTLTNTMELLVFEFSEDLKPFAAQFAVQLVFKINVARYVYANYGRK
jgi:hypothetical protein